MSTKHPEAHVLTPVQAEIVQRAITLSRVQNLRRLADVKHTLANEGYDAADIKVALRFWADNN